MNIVFLGTPDFAVPSLKAIKNSHHKILAVITQPDKPSDRGHKIAVSPVKEYAKENGLDVLQYKKIRLEGINDLKHLNPDVCVTCAYGQILSKELIDIPKYGIINIHASLLPKYRGAAPISWAVINGEKKSGVTLMRTDPGIDTGDILFSKEVEIGEDETTGELFDKLANVGAEMIVEGLDRIENGTAVFTPQDHAIATHYPMLKKEDGKIDFTKSAKEVKNLVRGMNPWPTAYFTYEGNAVKAYKAHVAEDMLATVPGEVLISDSKSGLFVSCGEGVISFDELQFPNAKRMDAKSFLNGREIKKGDIIK